MEELCCAGCMTKKLEVRDRQAAQTIRHVLVGVRGRLRLRALWDPRRIWPCGDEPCGLSIKDYTCASTFRSATERQNANQ